MEKCRRSLEVVKLSSLESPNWMIRSLGVSQQNISNQYSRSYSSTGIYKNKYNCILILYTYSSQYQYIQRDNIACISSLQGEVTHRRSEQSPMTCAWIHWAHLGLPSLFNVISLSHHARGTLLVTETSTRWSEYYVGSYGESIHPDLVDPKNTQQ